MDTGTTFEWLSAFFAALMLSAGTADLAQTIRRGAPETYGNVGRPRYAILAMIGITYAAYTVTSDSLPLRIGGVAVLGSLMATAAIFAVEAGRKRRDRSDG